MGLLLGDIAPNVEAETTLLWFGARAIGLWGGLVRVVELAFAFSFCFWFGLCFCSFSLGFWKACQRTTSEYCGRFCGPRNAC